MHQPPGVSIRESYDLRLTLDEAILDEADGVTVVAGETTAEDLPYIPE
jgi:hypothetical protein